MFLTYRRYKGVINEKESIATDPIEMAGELYPKIYKIQLVNPRRISVD